MSIKSELQKIVEIDLFKEVRKEVGGDDYFVGQTFKLDFDKALVAVADARKQTVKGIPHGTFLLAFYEGDKEISEALLLRALGPTKLPTDDDVVRSMLEYYKDNVQVSGEESKLDQFTRYEFSYSGLECRVLGTFYKNNERKIVFGADVENFYSPHHYRVYKPVGKALEKIINYRELDGNIADDLRLGKLRYSSTRRFQEALDDVVFYVSPDDYLGKRTSLFGMTRTGKSNTVKKIIEATVSVSKQAKNNLAKPPKDASENLSPLEETGIPKYGVGQIIFDVNGEYANKNMQDSGTAIFDLYKSDTVRYSVIDKSAEGFKVMKVNFYNDIGAGFELVRSHLSLQSNNYIDSFCAIDLTLPEDYNFFNAESTRYDRLKAAYLCCLYKAGFPVDKKFKVKFRGSDKLNRLVKEDGSIVPDKGITLEEACDWFIAIAENYGSHSFFSDYKSKNGKEWADDDLKATWVFLTRKKDGRAVDGYIKLRSIKTLHTETVDKPFDAEIIEELRKGRIIIIDLSQGNPEIQSLYSKRICKKIFEDSMDRFIKTLPNNIIQFYFEEAHNLFPKKEDKDLSQIYNRIAKEGAKLNLGMVYATQEVSSISSNILKNTQNWFIAHLNNTDEIKELTKYYDFIDFTASLVRFSSDIDQGFVRVKTYSNPFVVPVQIDRFYDTRKAK